MIAQHTTSIQMQYFLASLLVILIATAVFPDYTVVHFYLVGVYFMFKPNQQIFPNVAFWISFAISEITTIRKVIDVCESCEASKREPIWDCAHNVNSLAKSVILNTLTVYMAWIVSGTGNTSISGIDSSALKGHVSKHRDIYMMLICSCLTVLPLAALIVDMNYPIVDLMKNILDNTTNT